MKNCILRNDIKYCSEFSVKYNYLLETYETNLIRRAEKLEISNIINAHLGKSIF